MELPKLHIFQRDAGPGADAQAVAGVHESVGGRGIDAAGAAGGKQDGFGVEDIHIAAFHFHGSDAHCIAFFVADEVECGPFHEELGVGAHVLLIERVQHGMAGAVGHGAGAFYGAFAELGGMAAEGALVDFAAFHAVERHTHVFQLNHSFGRAAAHEFDGVLVAEPIGAFHGVVHVPIPAVFLHIAQRGRNAALRGHGVGAGGKYFGEHGGVEAGFGKLQRRTQAGTAAANDNGIEFSDRISHLVQPQITLTE